MFFTRFRSNQKNKLIDKIELYMQHVRAVVPFFSKSMRAYLHADQADFEHCSAELKRIEKDADKLLITINHQLYTYMLYPNIQKDISKLLNTLDDVIDTTKQVIIQLSIEKPDIPEFLKRCFAELTEASGRAVYEAAAATGCFFLDAVLVEDHVNKVAFYENEADKMEKMIKLKSHSTGSIESLSHRSHLCYFAEKMALPSDKAHRVAKDLLIYTINRDVYLNHFAF